MHRFRHSWRRSNRTPLKPLNLQRGALRRTRKLTFEPLEDRRVLATTLGVLAAGSTGSETLQLQIDGAVVANWAATQVYSAQTRVFQTFTYTSPADVTSDRIRVAFTNDGTTAGGADRNLYVDGITLDGIKYESEASNVYSTGTWDATTNGLLPGYRLTEALHYNGYFQYGAGVASTPTTVNVLAAGSTGTENLQLQIDGVPVSNWTTMQVYSQARVFQTFSYTYPSALSIDRIRVAFTNDGSTASGADRNLYVDGVTLNGTKYESEDPSVYSTGTWDAATNGLLPGFRQTEALHYDGYFQYGAGGAATTIQIFAAGQTGLEQMQLQIGGVAVATFNNVVGNYATGVFQTFTYNHPTGVQIGDVRVAFTNDVYTPGGPDRNLRVDAVALNGTRYETEAPTTYSTGTYVEGQGIVPGNKQSEYLHANGYFQYNPATGTSTTIQIRAAGATGQENMQLLIRGVPVATYANVGGNYTTGQFQTFSFIYPGSVNIGDVQVAFTNDGTTSGGADKNLRVDGITLGGIVYEAEAANVFSTGTYIAGLGARPGLWQSEYLHTTGSLQFGSTAVPGVLQLGTSIINVNESAGNANIPVTRTGGADGTVAVRYTTTNATALAGSDYTAQTGYAVFGPGQTTATIVVPIANDTLSEGNEAFNISVDYAIGGATVFEPRTATITIVDDDGPAVPGSGNGLLGKYYDDTGFQQEIFERTDSTINFNWGTGSPSSFVGADTFSIRWEGKVEPLYSQTYTFYATTDDGVRLWVNNQLLIDQWNTHSQTFSGTISLLAGIKYDIVMTYYENTGSASAKLEWSSASQTRQVVPQTQLYGDPPAPPVNGTFSSQTIVGGLISPTAMDFDSTGRIFISEQQGVVRVFQNGQLRSTPFVDLRQQVNNVQDRGMIGLAVHPDFPNTPYVYVSYVYDPPETLTRTGLAGPDGTGNRVARISRFTADPATGYNTAIPGSEYVLIGKNSTWANISHPELDSTDDLSLPPSGGNNGNGQDVVIVDARSHSVGNLVFGPDGMLYAANGDGASFGRVDPRAERVQSLDSLSGKILRVDPITGQGLANNPYYNGDPNANRSKVYDYGLRNPFRFAFHPVSRRIYIGDVGWNTWEEINVGGATDFGWPYYEGGGGTSLPTGGYRDLPEAQTFYATMPNVQPPLYSRTHTDGAVAIVAGDFYTGSLYPTSFQNALFIDDIGDGQVRILRVDNNSNLLSVTPLGLNVGMVVEMSMGRDGYMYYVDLGTGSVGRILFTPAGAALEAANPADFNEDGIVDGADFLSWQRGLGTTETAIPLNGDADGDGNVTAVDLAIWSGSFVPADGVGEIDEALSWLAFDQPNDDPLASATLIEPLVLSDLADAKLAKSLEPAAVYRDEMATLSLSRSRDNTTDAALDALGEEDPFEWIESP